MSLLGRDSNSNLLDLRYGEIFGYTIDLSVGDSGWYRLVPDGVTATRSNVSSVNLDNLRSDIDGIRLDSWSLLIANENYDQQIDIVDSEDVLVNLLTDLRLDNDVDDVLLGEDSIEYVLIPSMVLPLEIVLGGDGLLEIGYSTEFVVPGVDGYSREVVSGRTLNPTIKIIAAISDGHSVVVPTNVVRDLFYRVTNHDDDSKVFWRESTNYG